MFHLICDGVIHAWKGEQKLTMIWNHIHVHCISLHILHIHCISYSTMFAEQINVRGKVKKKLFGMGKPIYTCAHTINVLTTVIKWVNVRNSSHVWHGKISGGGGKWSNIQSWAILTILFKSPGAMNSHAMCPANGPLTICAKQLCLSIVQNGRQAIVPLQAIVPINAIQRWGGDSCGEISSNLSFAIYHVGRTLPYIMCNVVC